MVRKSILLTAAGIILVLAGCAPSTDSDEAADVPVRVISAEKARVEKVLKYNGDIKAEYKVRVFSKVPDRITSFFVDAGDVVAKGDNIAEIKATQLEQGVRQAKAGLTAATSRLANMKLEFERAKRLFEENAMSRQQYDAIQTQYEAAAAQQEQAEAALKSAKSTLTDAVVTAPISGIIGQRFFEDGDMAAPSQPLVTIVQVENVKMVFDVAEEDLGKIKKGQQSSVSVGSYAERTFQGTIHKISPVLDPVTRMATVEVLVPNEKKLLKPGMYANVSVLTGIIDDKIALPRYAVLESTNMKTVAGEDVVYTDYYVFTVNDSSRAVQKKLDVAYVNHRNIAVNEGVTLGEPIVVEGQNNLRDGTPVIVISKEEGE